MARLGMIWMLLLSCGGCAVQSLHTLATPETRVIDDRIVGRWRQELPFGDHSSSGDSKLPILVIEKLDHLTYLMKFEEETRSDEFRLTLVKLGDHLYIDALALPRRKFEGDFGIVRSHLLLRCEIRDDVVYLQSPDLRRLHSLLDEDETLSARLMDGRRIITADTQRIQEFLIKHGDSVFRESSSGTFRRLESVRK